MAPSAEPEWLSGWSARRPDAAEALARFDALEPAEPEAILGTWRGAELPTGHPLDGVLGALGWYGKRFSSLDDVQPLLFRSRGGPPVPVDPAFLPAGMAVRFPGLARSAAARLGFAAVRPLLRARQPCARLRRVDFRGRTSAAMVYDRQPIIDHFRRVDDARLLGLMDMRGTAPFLFLLCRERTA